MKVFSFVAATSNSGKTTLIEKIVPLLKARGVHVAVVKHASEGFELDTPGKDSWRFRQAGANAVVLVGPGRLAVMKDVWQQPSLREIEAMLPEAEIIILEGFKLDAPNRIEVFRSGISGRSPLCIRDPSFLALVSDRPIDVAIPRFDLNDAEGVAAFILSRIGK